MQLAPRVGPVDTIHPPLMRLASLDSPSRHSVCTSSDRLVPELTKQAQRVQAPVPVALDALVEAVRLPRVSEEGDGHSLTKSEREGGREG